MDRLTAFNNGIWELSAEAIEAGCDRYSLASRLSAYEDTGLMPEEITDIRNKIAECKEKAKNMSVEMSGFALYCFGRSLEDLSDMQAELERVKAEKDALLVDLKKAADDNGRCYGCKHLDEATDHCGNEEYADTCCLENNKWEWRGLEANNEKD